MISVKKIPLASLIFVAFCLQIYVAGSFRRFLSTMVTFSNQTVAFLAFSCFHNNVWFDDVLAVYMAVIGSVFYLLILPLNGIPEFSIVIMLDFIVHALIPMYHLWIWYNKEKRFYIKNFLEIISYPFVYYIFVMIISYRRGYFIYPFLNNPVYILLVTGIFYFVYVGLKKIKE